jgi:sulfur relay (sulfurtransferase) complex TusBCD TusD component (DsrE family)
VTRRLTFVLSAGPYAGQGAESALRLGAAALDAGHRPAIFASADGVCAFVKNQKTAGVFDVGAAATAFLERGGEAHL